MEDFETKELLNSVVTSLLDVNERLIALEEIAAEYVAEQEAATHAKD
ncbi:hypothetical protein RWE39_004374 [Salmonella enterica]|nr:hypothetical protein [Salmonella enterica]EMD5616183.1 hypothetical protein [Salmonella enterica]